jgi:hypothetical protein
MKITLKTLTVASSITALFGLCLLNGTDSPPPEIPTDFTGEVTLKCNQKLASNEMRYLFSAKATLDNGNMKSWKITQYSPFVTSINTSLEDIFIEMTDNSAHIKNRQFGFEISSKKEFMPAATLYVKREMKNGLYSPFGTNRSFDLNFYCTPEI